jgi:ubiquinol-cytochrome c reductase cytochrome b subunit
MSYLFIHGPYPSHQLIPRLFVLHIFILPAVIAALIGLHVALVWRQKHTQFPGPGRSESNVVGSPLVPQYAAKSMALFAAVVAVATILSTFVQINPIWAYGPYTGWTGVGRTHRRARDSLAVLARRAAARPALHLLGRLAMDRTLDHA